MLTLKVRVNHFNDSFITAEFSHDGGNAADTEPQTSVLSAVSGNKLVSLTVLTQYNGIENTVIVNALYEPFHILVIPHLKRVLGKIVDQTYRNGADRFLTFNIQLYHSFLHINWHRKSRPSGKGRLIVPYVLFTKSYLL